MIQPEVTFGGCQGGCGVGRNTCFVRSLPKKVLGEIPADMKKTLVGLHNFAQESGLREDLVISSALNQGAQIIEEVVNLYRGKLNNLHITIGDTSTEGSQRFYEEKLYTLGNQIGKNRAIFLGFDHVGEETEDSIYNYFEKALNTLITERSKMPVGKALGVNLGRNNSTDITLWLECYENLKDAIEFGRETEHENLDNALVAIRRIAKIVKNGKFDIFDICDGRTGFSHFFVLEILGQKLPIIIQVIPAVEQSDEIGIIPGGKIIPLIAPGFVAPFHNTYAMNAAGNRMPHTLYQKILTEITCAEDAVERYNQRFLEVLNQNS